MRNHAFGRIALRGFRDWVDTCRLLLRDERGAALVAVAAAMLALLSVVALAVDVGALTSARTEAQRAADAAALAGAGALVQSASATALARSLSKEYGSYNRVAGDTVELLDADVVIDANARTVRATVFRVAERNTAVPTFFARLFGVDEVDIAASATAEAAPAGGLNCILPVAMPDRWFEAGGPGNDPDDYNPEDGDYYVPWAQPGTDPPVFNDGFTGYSDADVGARVALKSNTGKGSLNPSWYYPWRPPGQSGASDYRENIRACVDPSITYFVNMQVDTEPGNMAGPTMQGFKALIDEDPTASWNANLDCVVSAGYEGSLDASRCRSSPRIRPIPMFDPTEAPDPGKKPFTFTNFAGVFVEEIQGKTVYGRWIGYRGVNPADASGPSAGPLFKVVRLID